MALKLFLLVPTMFSLALAGCGESLDAGGEPASDDSTDLAASSPLTATAGDDDGYVVTPFGKTHKDCVFDVGEGAEFDADDSAIVRGVRQGPKKACAHPAKRSKGNGGGSSDVTPTISGWLWDYNATATGMTYNWFTQLDGSWLVPQKPASYVGQTLFYFNGLEPSAGNAIIQPVLQYGPSSAGGGNKWTTAVWYIDHNGNVYHSSLVDVAVGVLLTGSNDSSNCGSTGHCKWTIVMKHGATVKNTMTWTTTERFSVGYPAVAEFYNFTACNQNPNQQAGMTFTWRLYGAGTSYNGRQRVYGLTAFLNYSATPWCNWRSGGTASSVTFAF